MINDVITHVEMDTGYDVFIVTTLRICHIGTTNIGN
jgi:hypothetical protein